MSIACPRPISRRYTPIATAVSDHNLPVARGAQGLRRIGLVWIEIKEEAIFQPNQLRDYAEQVKDPVHGEPNGKVLAITPPGHALPQIDTTPGAPRWEAKDW